MHSLSPLSPEMHVLVQLLRLVLSLRVGGWGVGVEPGFCPLSQKVGGQEAGEEAAAQAQSSDGSHSSGHLILSPPQLLQMLQTSGSHFLFSRGPLPSQGESLWSTLNIQMSLWGPHLEKGQARGLALNH